VLGVARLLGIIARAWVAADTAAIGVGIVVTLGVVGILELGVAVEVASAGYKAVAIVVARCCTFDGRGRSSWEGTVAAVAEGAVVEEAASIAEGAIDTAIVGVAGTATEGVVRIVIAA